MGFHATGALGFKPLHIQEAARAYFEDRRIIASWHNPPQMRVGPSFVTSDEDFENLESALKGTGEL
jgi:selenocysteine lyase/cysteine desulfurase